MLKEKEVWARIPRQKTKELDRKTVGTCAIWGWRALRHCERGGRQTGVDETDRRRRRGQGGREGKGGERVTCRWRDLWVGAKRRRSDVEIQMNNRDRHRLNQRDEVTM